jgi:hypothetical protein
MKILPFKDLKSNHSENMLPVVEIWLAKDIYQNLK